jgi:hypothetical protein
MPEKDPWLSPQGQARREQILQLAIREAGARRRQRRTIVAGAALLLAALIGGAILMIHPIQPPRPIARQPIAPAPLPAPATTPTTAAAPAEPTVIVERIETDPTLLDRLSIKPQPPKWTTISDEELLDTLAAAHQRAGLAEINGQMVVVSY